MPGRKRSEAPRRRNGNRRGGNAALKKSLGKRSEDGKASGDRAAGPRGRGKDDAVRGAAVCRRPAAEAGPGRPWGRFSGYGSPGAGAGNHDFLQAGGDGLEGRPADPAGHPGACGLLQRDGADPGRAGRGGAGHQRRRRRAGAYGDPLAAAEGLPGADPAVRQQDGSARHGPGGADAGAEEPPRGRLRGSGRAGGHGGGGPGLGGGHGGLPAGGGGAPGDAGPAGGGAGGLPLLLRQRAEDEGHRDPAGRDRGAGARAGVSGGLQRPGLQDQPGSPGRPADLDEDHRRQPEGQEHPPGRRRGGEDQPDPPVQRGPVPPDGGGGGRGGLRGHRAERLPGGGGPGRGGGPDGAAADAGVHLSGAAAPGQRSLPGPAPAADARGGGSPAACDLDRGKAGDPCAADGRGAAGNPEAGAGGPVRAAGGLQRGQHSLPGNHCEFGRGRRAL